MHLGRDAADCRGHRSRGKKQTREDSQLGRSIEEHPKRTNSYENHHPKSHNIMTTMAMISGGRGNDGRHNHVTLIMGRFVLIITTILPESKVCHDNHAHQQSLLTFLTIMKFEKG